MGKSIQIDLIYQTELIRNELSNNSLDKYCEFAVVRIESILALNCIRSASCLANRPSLLWK